MTPERLISKISNRVKQFRELRQKLIIESSIDPFPSLPSHPGRPSAEPPNAAAGRAHTAHAHTKHLPWLYVLPWLARNCFIYIYIHTTLRFSSQECGWDDPWFRLVGILVEAVQTVATMEHEQIRVDLAKTVTRQNWWPSPYQTWHWVGIPLSQQ